MTILVGLNTERDRVCKNFAAIVDVESVGDLHA